MKTRLFISLFFLILSLQSIAVYAELIETDLDTYDDGRVTLDTRTGLKWLDVTETFGLSYDEIISGTGNSWYADGWRFATTEEISSMVSTNLGVSVGCDGCPSKASIPEDDASHLISLFGANSNGWTNAYFDDGPVSEHAGQFSVAPDLLNLPNNIFIQTPNGIDRTVKSSNLGSLLVHTVPVPTIKDILAFFDESVDLGTLYGLGTKWQAKFRLALLRKLIEINDEPIEQNLIPRACVVLKGTHKLSEGEPLPREDIVAGPAAEDLANMIKNLMAGIGCK
jgi:hypothetical protein